MKEKLTLSIDKETKKRAKRYAKSVGKSISEIVEEYLYEISSTEDWSSPEGFVVEKLAGSLPIEDNRSYKEILADELQSNDY
jgi:hypothetical protein